MRILISGASGLIGSEVIRCLTPRGHDFIPLKRSKEVRETHPSWSSDTNNIRLPPSSRFTAVIHLAGENVGQRWTPAAKKRIRDSRVEGTASLSSALTSLEHPPEVVICASAIGYYGDRGEELVSEESPPGTGFLAEVCKEWEAAAAPIAKRGIRLVTLRLGIVLASGGALGRMLPLFKFGLGGRIGHGHQFWSWISLDDVVAVIESALTDKSYQGPFNIVAPEPSRNEEFTRTLANILQMPAVLPAPAFALKLVLGDMAQEALLASCRVIPKRLRELNFTWRRPELRQALQVVGGAN